MGSCPNEALLQVVTVDKRMSSRVFFGGFRPTVESLKIPMVRQRILREMESNAMLVDNLVDRYSDAGSLKELYELLHFLGKEWFLKNWRKVGGYPLRMKRELVMILSILDPDDPVREFFARFGQRLLRIDGFWRDDKENSSTATADEKETPVPKDKLLLLLLKDAYRLMNGDQEIQDTPSELEKDSSSKKQVATLRQRLEKEQATNRQLKTELVRETEKSATLQKEKSDLKKEYATYRHEQEALLQRLQDDYTQKLHLQYEEMQREFLNLDTQWLSTSSDALDEADELLERSEKVLEQQKLLDDKFGVRSELRQKEDKLRIAYMKLATAAKESFHIHGELKGLMDAIRRKRHAINSLLEKDKEVDGSEIYEYLGTTIKLLEHSDAIPMELENIRAFIQNAEALDILQSDECSNLQDLCDRRKSLWQNMSRTGARNRQSHDSDHIPVFMNLARHLQDAKEAVLIVDGYNVIMRSDNWKNYQDKNRLSFSQVRNEFIARCKKISGFFKAVRIVFDGDDPLSDDIRPYSDSFCVVYAQHREEEHNADRYILEYVQGLLQQKNKVWLCTEDYGIQNAAGKLNAVVENQALNRLLGM